jgi:hypothetical protein
MSGESNMLLTKLWREVEQPIKETPSLYATGVLRIDENALVLETHAQEGGILGLGLFAMCIGLLSMPVMFWSLRNRFYNPDVLAEMGLGFVVVVIFLTLALVAFCCLSIYLLHLLLILPAPSPVICDRRAGKIYGSHKGKPVELDWRQVKPVLTQSILWAGGVQRYYNLVFFQPEAPETWSGTGNHRGKGVIVSAGQPWGWQVCAAIAEFIRRYMEESPEEAVAQLPAVEPAIREEGWVTRWLNHGPYNELTEAAGRMDRLRRREGWPELSMGISLLVTLVAPAFLMNLLQVHARRIVQLPAAWWPKPATGPNPYATIESKPGDIELRRKAAKSVRNWLIICVGTGSALWAWVFAVAIRHL